MNSMISIFNITKLNHLLKDFFTLIKIRITVFDDQFQELAAYPEQIPPFCQIIRTDKTGKKECKNCDKHACETAAKRRASYTYRCHAGLTESITPLYMGNIVIGYLLFGHVFSYPSYQDGWRQISKLCSFYDLDMNSLHDACLSQPIISEEYILSASHILQAVASYLCFERMAIFRQKELPVQIDEYILKHFTEEIDVSRICNHFKIGKNQLYEISNQSYGMGIAKHIRKLRIEKAKTLLTEQADLHVYEVAFQCGFKDYNYFITVFKRIVGIPPMKYRLRALKDYN